MPNYIVKISPLRKGGITIPIGDTVELTERETKGIEHLLELVPEQSAAKGLNVADTIALIQAAQSIEELDKLAEGEERKSVLPAIEKRRAELAPA